MAIALAATLFLAACGRGSEVGSAVARVGDAAEVVYATGVVEPVYWAKVTALQRKRIVEMCPCEGAAVKKGDVLARLDDIEERAVLSELEARLARLHDDVARTTTLVERNIVSRTARSSSALAPTTCRAMIDDDAWPRAQALTSWAKSDTWSPSILRSTFTVEPQSRECAVADASGASSRPIRGMLPANSRICLL